MDIRIFTDERGFDDLKADWNTLLARSRSDTLFLTWEWQTTWWRCLGEGDLWLLAWYDQDQIVGIAPLYLIVEQDGLRRLNICLLYTSPSPRDRTRSRMPSSA